MVNKVTDPVTIAIKVQTPKHVANGEVIGATLKWLYVRVGTREYAFSRTTGKRRHDHGLAAGWSVSEKSIALAITALANREEFI